MSYGNTMTGIGAGVAQGNLGAVLAGAYSGYQMDRGAGEREDAVANAQREDQVDLAALQNQWGSFSNWGAGQANAQRAQQLQALQAQQGGQWSGQQAQQYLAGDMRAQQAGFAPMGLRGTQLPAAQMHNGQGAMASRYRADATGRAQAQVAPQQFAAAQQRMGYHGADVGRQYQQAQLGINAGAQNTMAMTGLERARLNSWEAQAQENSRRRWSDAGEAGASPFANANLVNSGMGAYTSSFAKASGG